MQKYPASSGLNALNAGAPVPWKVAETMQDDSYFRNPTMTTSIKVDSQGQSLMALNPYHLRVKSNVIPGNSLGPKYASKLPGFDLSCIGSLRYTQWSFEFFAL